MHGVERRFLVAIGVTALLLGAIVVVLCGHLHRRHVRELVARQGAVALQFDLAIRDYLSEEVRPLAVALSDSDAFYPSLMSSSYGARSIFERV
jgi:hypothetical protein